MLITMKRMRNSKKSVKHSDTTTWFRLYSIFIAQFQHQLLKKHEKELNNIRSSMKCLDKSRKTKEEIDASLQSKQEAAIRRERALAYAHTHQVLLNGWLRIYRCHKSKSQ